VFHAAAENVNDAALGDLALEAVEELLSLGAIGVQVEGFDDLGLRVLEEREQLSGVHRVVAVVIVGIPQDIADAGGRAGFTKPSGQREGRSRAASQHLDDQGFQAFF
jgi:hypothetical protein